MKPCNCDHPEYTNQLYVDRQCRICWLYYNNPDYHELWSGEKPSFMQKIVTFAGAVIDHVAAGLPVTPPEEQERRMALCIACEYYDSASQACRKCGCGCVAKARWKEQSCPINKW
jgi:hypothetical protein